MIPDKIRIKATAISNTQLDDYKKLWKVAVEQAV